MGFNVRMPKTEKADQKCQNGKVWGQLGKFKQQFEFSENLKV